MYCSGSNSADSSSDSECGYDGGDGCGDDDDDYDNSRTEVDFHWSRLERTAATASDSVSGTASDTSASSDSADKDRQSESQTASYDRSAYDERFLGGGLRAWIPEDLEHGNDRLCSWIDYTHFSLLFDRRKKSAILAMANVDVTRLVPSFGKRNFAYDEDILHIFQHGNSWYRNDPWDRGHLVRRQTIRWGGDKEAREAERDSDLWTNIVPQGTSMHQDEWAAVERAVFNIIFTYADRGRAIVVSGVYYDEKAPQFDTDDADPNGVRLVPNAYWKAVVYRLGGDYKQLHFWVPHDTSTLMSSSDVLFQGVNAASFIVDKAFITRKMGFAYDIDWRMKRPKKKKRRPLLKGSRG